MIRTRTAKATDGDHRLRGFSVLTELLEHETSCGALMLAITGRRPTDEERQLLDDLVVAMVACDPRIWPMKVGRLVGSYGGTMPPFCASNLAAGSELMGAQSVAGAARLLLEIGEQMDGGASLEDAVEASLSRRALIVGFGVAFRKQDERYVALDSYLERRGRAGLKYWDLQRKVAVLVRAKKRLEPNLGTGCAAFLLDMGFSPREAQLFVLGGLEVPHMINVCEEAMEPLRALGPDALEYVGPPARISPRKSDPSKAPRPQITMSSPLAPESPRDIDRLNVLEFLGEPDGLADPYALYGQLRARTPFVPTFGMPAPIFATYEKVQSILADERFSNSWPDSFAYERPLNASEEIAFGTIISYFRSWMQTSNAERHSRIRGLVHEAFALRPLAVLEGRIRELFDAVWRNVPASGEFDFVKTVAHPFPESVIFDLFDLPEDIRSEFGHASRSVFTFFGTRNPPPGALERIAADLEKVGSYLRELVRSRANGNGDDVISSLARAMQHGLTEQEVVVQCTLLLGAGHETTSALIGNALLTFLRHPAQWARLLREPKLVPTAVEECLRFESPSQWLPRIVDQDMAVDGMKLERGQFVWLALAAANRDPAVFENPDQFDVTRRSTRVLTFGGGAHYCLGAALARVQGRVALERMRDLGGSVRLVDYEWDRNFTMRNLRRLRVSLG